MQFSEWFSKLEYYHPKQRFNRVLAPAISVILLWWQPNKSLITLNHQQHLPLLNQIIPMANLILKVNSTKLYSKNWMIMYNIRQKYNTIAINIAIVLLFTLSIVINCITLFSYANIIHDLLLGQLIYFLIGAWIFGLLLIGISTHYKNFYCIAYFINFIIFNLVIVGLKILYFYFLY